MLTIHRRSLLSGFAALAVARPALAAVPELEIWKLRACGCCMAWAKLFESSGFATTVHEVDDVGAVSAAAGVPADLVGCHTARIWGYVIEGHVPVTAVQRLLAERPMIRGLAVPGMPAGSPGMEVEGMATEAFDVIAFAADGTRSVFLAVRP